MPEETFKKTHSRKSKGRDYWQNHVENWKQSGLTKAEYSRRHSLSANSLTNWTLKLEPTDKIDYPPVFVPVELKKPVSRIPQDIRIVLPNGITVSIPSDYPLSVVAPWITELAAVHA